MRKDKKKGKKEALKLIEKAEEAFDKNKELANNLVKKARNKAMSYNVRFPREVNLKFCKHCYSFLKPGTNCKIRTKKEFIIYTCLECNRVRKFKK
jgi:ribonuclease P protein subunit RPR2